MPVCVCVVASIHFLCGSVLGLINIYWPCDPLSTITNGSTGVCPAHAMSAAAATQKDLFNRSLGFFKSIAWVGLMRQVKQVAAHTHTHTHLTALYLRLPGWAGSRKVKSRFQKRKPNLDFTEARDNEWQWHQLGRMQVCNSLQTGNHAGTSPLSFSRLDALPATQPTASKHWRQIELLQYWQLKAASLLPPLNNFSSCQIFPVLYN